MIKVGITGGIGSGKTTVVNFFKALGIPAYIADTEAKRLMHQSPLREKIVQLFGSGSYTNRGALNRSYIAQRVFKDKHLLTQLNAIVHPQVEKDFQLWAAQQKGNYVIYEAAILFETGRYKAFDHTILVTAPLDKRITRLKKRDQSSEAEIRERMQNQWPDARKEKLADWIIVNEDIETTRAQVLRLHNILSRN